MVPALGAGSSGWEGSSSSSRVPGGKVDHQDHIQPQPGQGGQGHLIGVVFATVGGRCPAVAVVLALELHRGEGHRQGAGGRRQFHHLVQGPPLQPEVPGLLRLQLVGADRNTGSGGKKGGVQAVCQQLAEAILGEERLHGQVFRQGFGPGGPEGKLPQAGRVDGVGAAPGHGVPKAAPYPHIPPHLRGAGQQEEGVQCADGAAGDGPEKGAGLQLVEGLEDAGLI